MLGKKVVQLQKQLNLRSSQLLKPQSMVKPVANQMLCSTVEAQAHFCFLITLVLVGYQYIALLIILVLPFIY